MSYEEYKQMANLLVLHMRRIEDSVADGKFVQFLAVYLFKYHVCEI